MKSTFKKFPGSKIELEVLLTKDEFRPYWDTAHEHALANVHLKGFRPGAAPRELAEKSVDKERVFEEAANSAIRFSLDEIAKEKEWTFIDAPKVEILHSPDLGFQYRATLTVFPEVRLGNYKKIAKKVLAEKKEVKIDPAEVGKSLEWLRNSRAKVVRADREARKGDLVDIDAQSEADSLKGEKFILGQGKFVPGFEERLENRRAGENLEFFLAIPADYWHEKLRGQTLRFKVKINGVFERHLPTLDEGFAQSLGQNFKTVEDLKKSINEGLTQEKNVRETERLRIKMLDEIIKTSEMDIPEIMIEKTLDSMMKDYESMMKATGKKADEIRGQLRERAKNNVAGNLIIHKISQTERLEPAKEEIESEARSKNLDAEKFYDYIYGIILNKKVFNFLEHGSH